MEASWQNAVRLQRPHFWQRQQQTALALVFQLRFTVKGCKPMACTSPRSSMEDGFTVHFGWAFLREDLLGELWMDSCEQFIEKTLPAILRDGSCESCVRELAPESRFCMATLLHYLRTLTTWLSCYLWWWRSGSNPQKRCTTSMWKPAALRATTVLKLDFSNDFPSFGVFWRTE